MSLDPILGRMLEEIQALKERQAALEREYGSFDGGAKPRQETPDNPVRFTDGLQDVLTCLLALTAGKEAGDGAALQSVRLAELEDAVARMRRRNRLRRKLVLAVRELRDRFHALGFDPYAALQVEYLTLVVRSASADAKRA